MQLDPSWSRVDFSQELGDPECRQCGSWATAVYQHPGDGDFVVGCRDCLHCVADPDLEQAWKYFTRGPKVPEVVKLAHAGMAIKGIPTGERNEWLRTDEGQALLEECRLYLRDRGRGEQLVRAIQCAKEDA